jgi:hypothetical protein
VLDEVHAVRRLALVRKVLAAAVCAVDQDVHPAQGGSKSGRSIPP